MGCIASSLAGAIIGALLATEILDQNIGHGRLDIVGDGVCIGEQEVPL
jgi:hypothetical protein